MKNNRVVLALLAVALLIKCLLIGYGVTYQAHVDEWLIIKDPLKILLQYKDGNFSTTTNIFNFLLTGWHGITFVAGQIAGWWSGLSGFQDALSMDDARILASFRLLSVLLSLAGLYFWIRLFQRIIPQTGTALFAVLLVFVLNPFELNANNWLKFDPVCFLLYALEFTYAYRYFRENELRARKWMYIVLFTATATRIENIAFLFAFGLYDLWVVHRWNLEKFFSNGMVKTLITGIAVYVLGTLQFLALFSKNSSAPALTKTRTFEEVIVGLLDGTGASYTFYLVCGMLLLSPLVYFFFLRNLFRKDAQQAFRFFIPAIMLLSLILALDQVKNVHYMLATSCVLLFVTVVEIGRMQNAKLRWLSVGALIIWMGSYDVALCLNAQRTTPHREVEAYIRAHSTASDALLYDGVMEFNIPESPAELREKIISMQTTGGGTGTGLQNELRLATEDSLQSRPIFRRVDDFFWMGTPWENKWLIGMDTAAIARLQPQLIVVARKEFDGTGAMEKEMMQYLGQQYTEVFSGEYHFTDPRLYYRTYYYFHSFRIYEKR